jgi:hypothetical protein
MPDSPASTRNKLLEVEALLQFLIKSNAANDENADVVVPALAQSAKEKLSEAIAQLPQ